MKISVRVAKTIGNNLILFYFLALLAKKSTKVEKTVQKGKSLLFAPVSYHKLCSNQRISFSCLDVIQI